jgi:hypothetical protein
MSMRSGAILGLLCGLLAGCDSGDGGGAPRSPKALVTDSGDPVWFVESGAANGIVFEHTSGHGERYLFPETVTGGAALFDLDNDGDLDAYLVQGGDLNRPDSVQPGNKLFRNNGDGTFEDVTEGSGTDDQGYGMGVAAGDYDNDGDLDLYVTNVGANVFYRNEGDGRFTDVTAETGTGDPSWSSSCGFVDVDMDGDLDLFVANYLTWSLDTDFPCYEDGGAPDYCSPKSYDRPQRDTFYRNNGDGTFTDASVEAGFNAAYGNGLGVVTADLTGDGLVDIFVANDGMLNQLWENQGNGTFRDVARMVGTANDAHGLTKAGMGTDAADVDNDGDQDLIVVNLVKETDSFFRNEGGYFSDDTAMTGLSNVSRRYTRWGMSFQDFNHDGLLDIFQSNGRVTRHSIDFSDDPYAEPNLLMRGMPNGRFEEVEPRGGVSPDLIASSRGTAFGDVDNDGDIDILMCNRDGPAHLLFNVIGDPKRSITFSVVTNSGMADLNALVTCEIGEKTVMRQVKSVFSFQSVNDPRVHIGMGNATAARNVRVRWSDGYEESFGDFDAGARSTLRKGDGAPMSN